MTAVDTLHAVDGGLADLVQRFITWLETGVRPEKMFADDVFADFTIPRWRLQAQGGSATYHLREDGHPFPGRVRVEALDRTSRGFLLQIEERWEAHGQHWYCRELIHCVVTDRLITELSIFCTGDWDELVQQQHAARVRLIRP
jgi:hypothetical protein